MNIEQKKITESQSNIGGSARRVGNTDYSYEEIAHFVEGIAEKSPFRMLETEEGMIVVLAKHRLTDVLKTREEVEQKADLIMYGDWDFKCAVIAAIVEQTNIMRQEQEELTKTKEI